MSSIHNPVEKKRLSYARDHYAKGEYDKAFRRNWPRKKRKVNRAERRATSAKARAMVIVMQPEPDVIASKKKRLQKGGVKSLKEFVVWKLDKRIRRIGAKKNRRNKAI